MILAHNLYVYSLILFAYFVQFLAWDLLCAIYAARKKQRNLCPLFPPCTTKLLAAKSQNIWLTRKNVTFLYFPLFVLLVTCFISQISVCSLFFGLQPDCKMWWKPGQITGVAFVKRWGTIIAEEALLRSLELWLLLQVESFSIWGNHVF
jgi:hypothetical protein